MSDRWRDYVEALREWVALDEAFWTDPSGARLTARMNRLARLAAALHEELAARPGWRSWNEQLLQDPLPGLRLAAALNVADWDLDRALMVIAEVEASSAPGASRAADYAAERLRQRQSGPEAGPPAVAWPDRIPAHPSTFDPDRERVADAVLPVHGATVNGGFLTASGPAGDYVSDAIAGFERIELGPVAELLRMGTSLFPSGVVPVDANERQRLIDVVIDQAALEELGAQYDSLVPSDDFLSARLDSFLDA